MIRDDYTCDGQIELEDYLMQLEEETKKCTDCIYFKDFKCVRRKCFKLAAADGWHPMWYDKAGRVYGDFVTCQEWQPVETVVEGKEIITCEARGKDKTFIWPKDTLKQITDDVIAWRYKGEA